MTLPFENVVPLTPTTAPADVFHYRGHRKPRDYRCRHCARLIMRAVLVPECYIEHRCGKCGRMCIITFEPNGNGEYDLHDEKPVVKLEQEKVSE
jgi:phage FluMu protein Com